MTYEFLKSLYKDLLSMLSGIVIKREDLAKAGETADTFRNFEIYLACVNGTRTILTFPEFHEEVLSKYLSPAQVKEVNISRKNIPANLVDAIVRDEAQYVIDHYVERNNYYRTLMGLPALDDVEKVYIKDIEYIPDNVPIHEMSTDQISRLEILGLLSVVIEEHPDKEYLRHLGVNSINFIDARLARPFEILRLGPSSNPRSVEMFKEEYYYARRHIMMTCYNQMEYNNKTLYYPVIGLLMLTLAMRNTMVPDEPDYLNFEEILDAILESYGLLRYFKTFPYLYKRRLVLALDRLIKVKGTDGVLVDVCKLFSDEDLIATRYYLMKTYALDKNHDPILSGDPDRDYVVDFVRASIDEHDINTQEEKRENYYDVVDNDYLWQLTEEELRQLKTEDFNLMMAKYIDVETAFEVTTLVFEVCCFINLLLYARDNLGKVSIDNVYATNGRCTLFAMLNFLLAAMAKRAHFDGNIVYAPMDIAEIWRFNYGDIEAQIKEIAEKYELRIDVNDTLLEGFELKLDKPYGLMDSNDILQTYVRNRELYEAICEEMNRTNDIDRYTALHNCRDVFFTSATEMESFALSSGGVADTYYDMLLDIEPRLAAKLDTLEEDDDLNALIVYILERLDDLFSSPELKYLWLNTPTIYGAIIGKYIRIAINVFKAAFVQLRSINVFLKLGDKDPIHVIDKLVVHKTKEIDEVIHVFDEMSKHKTRFIDEYIVVGDKVYTNVSTVRYGEDMT